MLKFDLIPDFDRAVEYAMKQQGRPAMIAADYAKWYHEKCPEGDVCHAVMYKQWEEHVNLCKSAIVLDEVRFSSGRVAIEAGQRVLLERGYYGTIFIMDPRHHELLYTVNDAGDWVEEHAVMDDGPWVPREDVA